jgi:lysophospholipase L1-like esterase
VSRFERYVAIGDSTTEGLDDPDGLGGFRGWANRLAERIAAEQGSVLYANLGIRGLRTRQIRETQLPVALEMRPDLATVVSGTNDLLAKRFDPHAFAADVEAMQCALRDGGATVLTFTLPDISRLMPLARPVRGRLERMNAALRAVSARTGAKLVDFAAHDSALDPRFWSDDRLHANSLGHERIAGALAHAIALPGAADSWTTPLEAPAPRRLLQLVGAELAWTRRHLAPWIWRHARGRSSGDGRTAKRPTLQPLRGRSSQR